MGPFGTLIERWLHGPRDFNPTQFEYLPDWSAAFFMCLVTVFTILILAVLDRPLSDFVKPIDTDTLR